MDKIIRDRICNILLNNKRLLQIAIKQRAKFEGWLKFELAHQISISNGFQNVEVEKCLHGQSGKITDIAFSYKNINYYLELKTANTSWKINGVMQKKRPITDNINSIIIDAQKLKNFSGVVAFVLFPVLKGDERWHKHVDRISKEIGISGLISNNCETICMDVDISNKCEAVICSFKT